MHSYGVAGVEYGGRIYFSGFGDANGLFEFNPESGKIVQKLCFAGEICEGFYHSNAFLYKNDAWFIPWDAKKLVCVNLETMEETYYSIVGRGFKGHAFIDCVSYNSDKLVLVPSGDPLTTVAVINLATHDVECIPSVITQEICIGAYLCDNSLSFVNSNGEVYAKLNLKNGEKEKVERANNTSLKYNSIIQDESKVYLIPYKKHAIVVIDVLNELRISIPIINSTDRFKGGLVLPSCVVIFPRDSTDAYLKIDRKTGAIERCLYPYSGCMYGWMEIRRVISDRRNGVAISFNGDIVRFNNEGEIVERKSYIHEIDNCINVSCATDQEKIALIKNLRGDIVNESERVTLINLIQAISN